LSEFDVYFFNLVEKLILRNIKTGHFLLNLILGPKNGILHIATVLSKSPEAAVKIPYGKKYTISFYDIFSIKIPYLIDLKPENVKFLVRNVFFLTLKAEISVKIPYN